MKQHLWEFTCGLTHFIFMFLVATIEIIAFSKTPYANIKISEPSALDFMLLFILLIICLLSIIASFIVAGFFWSKITSKRLNKEYRENIFHRLYRTPNNGVIKNINTRYVNWIIKNT